MLACGFLPDVLREALGEGSHAGARVRYVAEPRPLGTAGAIRFAADELGDELGERFLALNGDVLTDLDLTALLDAHESAARGRRSACTRSTTPPPTASSTATRTARCCAFLEKTGEHAPGEVNAGMYVLERSVLDLIPPASRSRSSATSSRGWSATASTACRSTATGWTSARRSATCRRAGTSSTARSRPGSSRARRGCWSTRAPRSPPDARVGPRAVIGRRLPGRRRARRSGTRSCSTAAPSAPAPGQRLDPRRRRRGRARRQPRGRRDRPG